MNHADLLSPEIQRVLRTAGWSPEWAVDITHWVSTLRAEGNAVPSVAMDILKGFGGIKLRHRGAGGASYFDFDVDPSHWFGMRDEIQEVERAVGCGVCPLGEILGASMLAVLDDGRIIVDKDGDISLLGRDWSQALDLMALGRGGYVRLAEDYVPVEHEPPG
jgi:hypothetical protein